MALLVTAATVAFSILLTPFLLFLLTIIFLASIGKSIGVRRLYVKLLLKVFEYGRQHIERARKKEKFILDSSESEDEEKDGMTNQYYGLRKGDNMSNGPSNNITSNHAYSNHKENHKNSGFKMQNGHVPSGTSPLISREDLILEPDPECNHRPFEPNHNDSDYLNDEKTALQEKDGNLLTTANGKYPRRRSFETLKREFELSDCLDYIKAGVESIIEDEVTQRFEAEDLKSWNLLTRTNRRYEFISWKLTIIWMLGFFVRYFFLLPLRVLICFIGVVWTVVSASIVGLLPDSRFKRWLNKRASLIAFRIFGRSLSVVLTFHNQQFRPSGNGICVANHTTPVDIVMLATENVFSLIGQRHGGFLGVLQRALARASSHIWFERSEVKDREAVARRLREHVSDPTKPPILIFPEGTCINNTSVMQFKKGSFEVGGTIYPVAIKYDAKFGDAFWNSSKYSMMQYLYMMMTSWAIVCDVWYLPPMHQRPDESAIDFANRVKAVIARQGGLVDLMWDGQLKRMKPKKEWKEKQQEEFSKRLKVE